METPTYCRWTCDAIADERDAHGDPACHDHAEWSRELQALRA